MWVCVCVLTGCGFFFLPAKLVWMMQTLQRAGLSPTPFSQPKQTQEEVEHKSLRSSAWAGLGPELGDVWEGQGFTLPAAVVLLLFCVVWVLCVLCVLCVVCVCVYCPPLAFGLVSDAPYLQNFLTCWFIITKKGPWKICRLWVWDLILSPFKYIYIYIRWSGGF